MAQSRKSAMGTQELGLEAGMAFCRFFLDTEHLHYGFWPDDLPVSITNLRRAQDHYTAAILAHIPEGSRTILDVGCGSGCQAHRLSELGYEVECVSPSPFLTQEALKRLGGNGRIYECRFEDLRTDRRYDVVLFSESFQYIDPVCALTKARDILNDNGHLIICDFFRKDTAGKCMIGGGHRLGEFFDMCRTQKFETVVDLDVTKLVLPTVDLANQFGVEVLAPAWISLERYMVASYPRIWRLLKWKFRKKIEKARSKYFDGGRTGAHFAQFKSYRLMVLRKLGEFASNEVKP